jgi:putative tryptophan/tyrosine transport system substrate-binding protein
MATRRQLILAGILSTVLRPALGQRVRRIGYLSLLWRSSPTTMKGLDTAFAQGMRDAGYVEGKNLVIEWRFAEGKPELLGPMAEELVRLNVEAIVTGSTQPTQAAKRATSTVPIVFPAAADPVGSGFVSSLARPGGNATGLSASITDLSPKHVELIKAVVPNLSQVGVMTNPRTSSHPGILEQIETAAREAGLKVIAMSAASPKEMTQAVETLKRHGAQAFILVLDAQFVANRKHIVALSLEHRLPAIFGDQQFVEAGGLMSYGQDLAAFYRRAATYVDRILKGAKPAELPVEQPTIFKLAINRATAAKLGMTIPPELIVRADEVLD